MAKKTPKAKKKARKGRVVKEVVIPRAKTGCRILLGPDQSLVVKSDKEVVIPRAFARVIPTAKQGCDG